MDEMEWLMCFIKDSSFKFLVFPGRSRKLADTRAALAGLQADHVETLDYF